MQRRINVPFQVSRQVGALGLPRDALLDLFLCVHRDVARDYAYHQQFRDDDDDKHYRHRIFLTLAGGAEYMLNIIVDDTTSIDHLIIVRVESYLF